MPVSTERAICNKQGVKTYKQAEKLSIRGFLILLSEYFLHKTLFVGKQFESICHQSVVGVN
ncbi:MAG: hypothetical protein PVG35_00340 [Desulfobacterales bacterium]|jgi:hypothetical protein